MTLEFMYIPGISDSNTLYFATNADKNSYFNLQVTKRVDYSFFPPKYTDELKMSITDVDLNSRYNYLRFEWRQRYYYYFIDSVDYVNEDVIQLNIRMDTIITYYHDIGISEGIVERKHINRFVSPDSTIINRDYIRENVSDGLFREQAKMSIVGSTDTPWLIVKTTAELRAGTNTPRASYIKAPVMEKEFPCAYGLYIGPLDNKDINISYADGTSDTVTYPYINLIAGIKDNRVVDIYVCPFQPIEEITYVRGASNVNGELHCNWSKTINANDIIPYMTNNAEQYTGLGVNGNFARITQAKHTHFLSANPIGFIKNQNDNVLFDKRYIPCLKDENYMRIVAGSETANTSYPIHTINQLDGQLAFTYSCNIEDGTRTYNLYDNLGAAITKFSTMVIDSNVMSMSLANDPWKDYQANIKGRLFSVGMDMITSGFNSFVDIASTRAATKIKVARIKDDKSAWDRRASRNPRLKKKYASKIDALNDDASIDTRDALANVGKGIIGSMGNEISAAANAMWAAPSAKQLGNMLDSDTSYQMPLWYQWSIVEDIDFVAQYYHKYGNLVNINYYDEYSGWYNYFHNRKYFNYIKFATITAYLRCLGEQDVIEDIERRFTNGMTMWRTDNAIGTDYLFDNIELFYE